MEYWAARWEQGSAECLFDPISMATHTSKRQPGRWICSGRRLATGIGMGLVESALKDRWLYVVSGPLAGKQFILYKSANHHRQLASSRTSTCSKIQIFLPNVMP